MELMLFTCARSIHINTDRKQLKQVLHFRFSFEPRFSEVDKSLFRLALVSICEIDVTSFSEDGRGVKWLCN